VPPEDALTLLREARDHWIPEPTGPITQRRHRTRVEFLARVDACLKAEPRVAGGVSDAVRLIQSARDEKPAEGFDPKWLQGFHDACDYFLRALAQPADLSAEGDKT
jgi:hypothetical protein